LLVLIAFEGSDNQPIRVNVQIIHRIILSRCCYMLCRGLTDSQDVGGETEMVWGRDGLNGAGRGWLLRYESSQPPKCYFNVVACTESQASPATAAVSSGLSVISVVDERAISITGSFTAIKWCTNGPAISSHRYE